MGQRSCFCFKSSQLTMVTDMYSLERIPYHALFQFLSLPVYYRNHSCSHQGYSLYPVSCDLLIVSCIPLISSKYSASYFLFTASCISKILYLSISLVYTQGLVEDIEILPSAISGLFSEIWQPNNTLFYYQFFIFLNLV